MVVVIVKQKYFVDWLKWCFCGLLSVCFKYIYDL